MTEKQISASLVIDLGDRTLTATPVPVEDITVDDLGCFQPLPRLDPHRAGLIHAFDATDVDEFRRRLAEAFRIPAHVLRS